MRIGLFVGDDVTSHLIVNEVVQKLLAAGHSPYIFFTRQPSLIAGEYELRQLFRYERTLLNEYVYPFLDGLAAPLSGVNLSPAGIAKLYPGRVAVRVVKDVNDRRFIDWLVAQRVTVAFSVRCYQKFSPQLIGHFRVGSRPALLANLHPGILPQYRGVLTFARAMQRKEQEAGFTLHRMNENWDAGGIIATSRQPLDYGASVLENMLRQRVDAAELVVEAVKEIAAEGSWLDQPQDPSRVGYYSHLTRADLDELGLVGVDLFRPQSVIDLLVSMFTPAGSPESYRLSGLLAGVTSNQADHLLG